MVNQMLPPDLSKLMRVADKYLSKPWRSLAQSNGMKEVAAVKCIIDFRIAYFTLVGCRCDGDVGRYLQAASHLHKRLTS